MTNGLDDPDFSINYVDGEGEIEYGISEPYITYEVEQGIVERPKPAGVAEGTYTTEIYAREVAKDYLIPQSNIQSFVKTELKIGYELNINNSLKENCDLYNTLKEYGASTTDPLLISILVRNNTNELVNYICAACGLYKQYRVANYNYDPSYTSHLTPGVIETKDTSTTTYSYTLNNNNLTLFALRPSHEIDENDICLIIDTVDDSYSCYTGRITNGWGDVAVKNTAEMEALLLTIPQYEITDSLNNYIYFINKDYLIYPYMPGNVPQDNPIYNADLQVIDSRIKKESQSFTYKDKLLYYTALTDNGLYDDIYYEQSSDDAANLIYAWKKTSGTPASNREIILTSSYEEIFEPYTYAMFPVNQPSKPGFIYLDHFYYDLADFFNKNIKFIYHNLCWGYIDGGNNPYDARRRLLETVLRPAVYGETTLNCLNYELDFSRSEPWMNQRQIYIKDDDIYFYFPDNDSINDMLKTYHWTDVDLAQKVLTGYVYKGLGLMDASRTEKALFFYHPYRDNNNYLTYWTEVEHSRSTKTVFYYPAEDGTSTQNINGELDASALGSSFVYYFSDQVLETKYNADQDAYSHEREIGTDSYTDYLGIAKEIKGAYEIGPENILGAVNYIKTANEDDSLDFTTASSASITVEINYPVEEANKLINKQFSYFVELNGEWKFMGLFIIEEAESIDLFTSRITGHDYISRFNKYIDDFITLYKYPTTLGAFWHDLCDYCDVSYDTHEVLAGNADLELDRNFIAIKTTGLDLVKSIAQLMGGYIHINKDTLMAEIGGYTQSNIVLDKTIYTDINYSSYYCELMNQIRISYDEGSTVYYNNLPLGATPIPYYISDNPLTTYNVDEAKAKNIVNNLISIVNKLPRQYKNANIHLLGQTQDEIKVGDIITIKTPFNDEFKFIVMELKIDNSGITISSFGEAKYPVEGDNINPQIIYLQKMQEQIGNLEEATPGGPGGDTTFAQILMTTKKTAEENKVFIENTGFTESDDLLNITLGGVSKEAAKKGYVDSKATTTLNSANGYSNTKLAEAKTYADGKLAEAKTYTDNKTYDASAITSGVFADARIPQAIWDAINGMTGEVVMKTSSGSSSVNAYIWIGSADENTGMKFLYDNYDRLQITMRIAGTTIFTKSLQ